MKRAKTNSDKAKRQDIILKSALIEFAQRGVESTRMDDIAQTAGVSKGTLYLYFKSKDALFSALIHDYAGGLIKSAIVKVQRESEPRQALRVFADTLSRLLVEKELAKILPLLVANVHRTPEIISDYRQNIIEVALPILIGIFRQGVDTGVFRPHDSTQYAMLIIAPALQKILFQALFAKDSPLTQKELKNALTLQLDMIFTYLAVRDE